MTKEILTAGDLDQFTGSDHFYRHSLNRHIIYTDGGKYMATQAGAYWLIDEIALHGSQNIRAEAFQVWTLKVKNGSATLVVDDGNGNKLKTKKIEYTDFPLTEITLWAERNAYGGHTIMLPNER